MKTILLSSLFIIFSFTQSSAQCDADGLCNSCVPKLGQGFSFLKTYKIYGDKDLHKIEYSYVFAKGTQYMLTLCDQNVNASTINITIYDSQRNKIASNKIEGKFVSAISFPCNATGIYYIQYTFDGQSTRCGGSALGFKRS